MGRTGRNKADILQALSILVKAHPWHGVSIGEEAPEIVTTFVEIVPSDTVKYELDKTTGLLKIDRPQQYSNATILVRSPASWRHPIAWPGGGAPRGTRRRVKARCRAKGVFEGNGRVGPLIAVLDTGPLVVA